MWLRLDDRRRVSASLGPERWSLYAFEFTYVWWDMWGSWYYWTSGSATPYWKKGIQKLSGLHPHERDWVTYFSMQAPTLHSCSDEFHHLGKILQRAAFFLLQCMSVHRPPCTEEAQWKNVIFLHPDAFQPTETHKLFIAIPLPLSLLSTRSSSKCDIEVSLAQSSSNYVHT